MDMNKLLAMADKASSEIAARSGGFERPVKPAPGQSRWRILPPWKKGGDRIFRTYGQHFIKGPDGKIAGAFVCPSASAEEPGSVSCVHCDEVAAVARLSKDDDVLRTVREFRAGETYLFNAIRTDGDEKDKVVLLSLPGSLANTYFQTLASYLREEINILDPNEGRDIIVNRTGTGLTTKYSMTVAPKSSKVPKEVLDNLIDIDGYIEKETNRGKTNIAKFIPALTSVARHVGLPSAEVTHVIQSVEAMYSGSAAPAAIASAPKASGPALSKPTDSSDGRVMDGSMPWEKEGEKALSKTPSEDVSADALAELEALEAIGGTAEAATKAETPAPTAEAEKPKAKAPASEDEDLSDFLDTL